MSTADLQSLAALLERSPHGRDPAAGPVIHRIAKELTQRRARGDAASADMFRSATSLLAKVAGTAHGECRISALAECYRYFYQIGDFPRALGASSAIGSLAQLIEQRDSFSLAKNLEGVALTEMGDVGQALISFAQSLEIAENTGNVERQASVLGNTGMALNSIGLHRPAISCLKRSISFHTHHVPTHSLNLAQSYLELGQYENGVDALDLTSRLAPEPADSLSGLSRCVWEFTYTQLALALNDLALARRHSEACVHYSTLAPRARYLGNIALALCDVRSGNAKSGIRTLQRTLRDSESLLTHSVDCHSALVKAYDEVGNPEQALHYLAKLLALLRTSRLNSVQGLVAWSLELEGEMPAHLALRESDLRARAAERRTEAVTVEMLERLAVTADMKEDSSGDHGRRVGALSRMLAKALGWSDPLARDLELAARLHDIGKIAIPESILRQPGPLHDHARAFMRTHCEAGAEMLANSSIPKLRLAESVARCHHEAWDGSGYPRRLRQHRIPIAARIVAIADTFDALTHDRTYSSAWSFEKARELIIDQAGGRFDPEIASVFVGLIDRLKRQFPSVDFAIDLESEPSPVSDARRRIDRLVTAGAI